MGFRKAACTNLWVPPSFSETAFVLFLGFLFFFLSIFMGTVYISLTLLKNGVCHQWKNKKISEPFNPGKP